MRELRHVVCVVAVLSSGCFNGVDRDAAADGDGDGTTDAGTTGGSADDDGDDGGDGGTGETGDVPPETMCDPAGGGPHWLEETETVSFTVTCAKDLDLPPTEFSLTPLPDGAQWDAATATFTWTPGLDQGAVYELTVEAASVGETGIVKVGVADKFDDPNNVPVVDPLLYTEEYGIPVLHMQTSPTINPDAYEPATIIYRGQTMVGAESKLRGAVSLNYPKNSYTLKFTNDRRFSDEAYDFLYKRKVTMITAFDDNSYVRQRLGYELWNRLDPDHIQVQTYSGVMFLDGEFWGVYTIADHVDRHLMAQHGLTEAGNLYKARTHDANFRLTLHQGGNKATLHDGYTKSESEGAPIDDFSDLEALVQFVATAPDPAFVAEIDDWVDRRDYENWWIWVSFIKADDSAGKNSYHHHMPMGGQFRMIPWDLNHSFGQDWQTRRVAHDDDLEARYISLNEMFTRLLGAPEFGPAMRDRYATTLGDQYDKAWILARIDEMVTEIDAVARRDERRWGAEYRSYWSSRNDLLDYDGELDYLRQWVTDRWDYARAAYP